MDKLDYADKRCLVVEDRRPFLNLLRGLLTSLGAKRIDTEMSAESALKACKKVSYDIVICDLHLGSNRKNGFEFLEEVRKLHLIKPAAVFIMISGDSGRSMVLGSIEKQPDDYLVKPFSQAQLNARITRAKNKRMALSALYSQIEHGKYELSIDTCEHFLEVGTKYTSHCVQILVQLFWKTEQYDKAEALLSKVLKQRAVQWALSAMAKTKLLKNEFQEAIELAKQAIDASRNDVESYDILSQAYLENEMPDEALKYIKDAIALSPLSIERQFKVCEIARANGDFVTAMESSNSIFELSQRSVHRDVNHMCSYIRSILDAAENAENKKDGIRLMQDAELTLKKIKLDENALKIQKGFDFDIFEKLIHARVSHLNGRSTESKTNLEEAQIKIEQQFVDFPIALAADSLKLMLDLGDFEEALKASASLTAQGHSLDPNVQSSIDTAFSDVAEKQKSYIAANKSGIRDYSEGRYANAYDFFKQAKEISPTNIGVTLNLLQSIVKLLESSEKGNATLQQECREHYRFVKNMPLREVHKHKFENIQNDVEKVMSN